MTVAIGTPPTTGPHWTYLGRSTLGSAAASITLSSLSTSGYRKLLVRVYGINSNAASRDMRFTFNGDGGANYGNRYANTVASSSTDTILGTGDQTMPGSGTFGGIGFMEFEVLYDAGTIKYIQNVQGANYTATVPWVGGVWSGTADITSIAVSSPSNFNTGSYIEAYGWSDS